MRHSAPAPLDCTPVSPARRRWLAQGLAGAAVLTPGLSWSRPKAVDKSLDVQRKLPEGLRSRLAASGLPLSSFGVYVEPVEGGAPVVAVNAAEPFVMASTAKIVTSLAALDLLGPRYRWRTSAYLQGTLVEGHLYGDLLIVGGGDVLLSTSDLRAWFERMQSMGLRHIHGDIVLDRAAFRLAPADFRSTPEPAPDRPHHIRPNALTLDAGVIRVAVQAARSGRAQVSVNPPMAGVQVLNSVAMQGGCSAYASVRVPHRHAANQSLQLQVQGSWSANCGSRAIEFAPLPVEELTERAVGELWREVGGEFSGEVQDHTDPSRQSTLPQARSGEPLAMWSVHGSPPLSTWIHGMNKVSDNVAARHLMLSMAPGFPRRPATLEAAQLRVSTWLRDQGLSADDLVLDNGSGLSRAERAKPRAMVQLLRRAWVSPNAQTFIDSLPVAGIDGTLVHRLTQRNVQGQAHLKTGTLLDTRALAGYVHARSGRWYALSAMANHPEAAQATPSLDGLIDWLVTQG